METLELWLHEAVNLGIILFEFMGVIVIAISGVKGVLNYIRRNPQTRLQLAQGMALALEFKLGSEILRTVIVREISEIATVAGIICLRAALTFLIHWEIKAEEQEEAKEAVSEK